MQPENIKKILIILFLISLISGCVKEEIKYNLKDITEPSKYGIRNEIIHINKELLEELNKIFLNTPFEFSGCVTGDKQDLQGAYNLTIGNSTKKAPPHNCHKLDTILLIHSHPSGKCYLSYRDAIIHYNSNTTYMGIICNKDKIMIYSSDDYYKNYQIIAYSNEKI